MTLARVLTLCDTSRMLSARIRAEVVRRGFAATARSDLYRRGQLLIAVLDDDGEIVVAQVDERVERAILEWEVDEQVAGIVTLTCKLAAAESGTAVGTIATAESLALAVDVLLASFVER